MTSHKNDVCPVFKLSLKAPSRRDVIKGQWRCNNGFFAIWGGGGLFAPPPKVTRHDNRFCNLLEKISSHISIFVFLSRDSLCFGQRVYSYGKFRVTPRVLVYTVDTFEEFIAKENVANCAPRRRINLTTSVG